MESSFLALLGPYGKNINFNQNPATTAESNGTKAKPPATAAPTRIVPFSAKNSKPPTVPTLPTGRGPKNSPSGSRNLQAYHKKQNIKFIEGADSRRAGRVAEMEMLRKQKRTETIMSKRKVSAEADNTDSDLDLSNGNNLAQNNAFSKISGKQTNTPLINGADESDNVNNKISDARKMQLLKWKQEKNAFDDKSKKPPFRPGGLILNGAKKTAQTNNTKPPVPVVAANSRTTRINHRPPTVPAATSTTTLRGAGTSVVNNKEVGAGGGIGERRVTRAMAQKTQAPPPGVSSTRSKPPIGGSNKTANQPPTQTLKNLNLNGRNAPPKATNDPSTAKTKINVAPQAGNCKNLGKKIPPVPQINEVKLKPSILKSTASKSAVPPQQGKVKSPSTPAPPVPQAVEKKVVPPKIKKLKPKGIDPIYTEYNLTFSKACELLTNHAAYWRNIIDAKTEMSEEMRDDIISALGKSKLLLDSKLPQFSELLYSYICKEEDPMPVLQCDLQGWWDVASIQVDAVDLEFKGLKSLEQNNWVKPKVQQMQKPKKKAKSVDAVDSNTPAKSNVTASQGIKAFLAMKRKGQTISSENVEKKKIPSPTADHKFEGGFFTISSPARKTPIVASLTSLPKRSSLRLANNGNVSLNKTPSRTPNRRTSGNEVGLRVLSMRKSMGPIYKIGVRNDFYAELPTLNDNEGMMEISED